MTLKELKAFVKFAKKEGYSDIQVGDVHLKVDHPLPTYTPMITTHTTGLVAPTDITESIKAITQTQAIPSDEDFLHWSGQGPLPSEVREAQLKANPNPERLNG